MLLLVTILSVDTSAITDVPATGAGGEKEVVNRGGRGGSGTERPSASLPWSWGPLGMFKALFPNIESNVWLLLRCVFGREFWLTYVVGAWLFGLSGVLGRLVDGRSESGRWVGRTFAHLPSSESQFARTAALLSLSFFPYGPYYPQTRKQATPKKIKNKIKKKSSTSSHEEEEEKKTKINRPSGTRVKKPLLV